jgi:SAM-dependent methyltransferase
MERRKKANVVEGEKLSPATVRLMSMLGQVDAENYLRPEGRDKIAQVMSFLPLMEKVLSVTSKRKPLSILECACGKGHLSLLLNQILMERYDRELLFIGIDSSERLVEKCRRIAGDMGYGNVEYHVSTIADFDSEGIDMLLSLHACDTATDESLVKGLELGCRFVFLVPCCQSELSRQLTEVEQPLYLPMTGNYTHRKILGSLLTDSLRRLVLEAFGYKVDVFEYVSVRRTEKNIMMRAVRGSKPDADSWRLFLKILSDLNLEMRLERMMEDRGLRPEF